MADNVLITAGAGTSIATDDVGGIHYQKFKLDAGGDGLAVPVIAGQKVMTLSVPVVIASDQTPVQVDGGATTVTLYAKTLTNANTEYSQALPATCRRVALKCRTAYDIRLAFVTGKVATPTDPYLTINTGTAYDSGPIKLASGTVYLASAQAGVVVEIEAWS